MEPQAEATNPWSPAPSEDSASEEVVLMPSEPAEQRMPAKRNTISPAMTQEPEPVAATISPATTQEPEPVPATIFPATTSAAMT